MVGVVADVRSQLDRDPGSMVYVPYWRRGPSQVSVAVRTIGEPAARSRTRSRPRCGGSIPRCPSPTSRRWCRWSGAHLAERRFQTVLVGALRRRCRCCSRAWARTAVLRSASRVAAPSSVCGSPWARVRLRLAGSCCGRGSGRSSVGLGVGIAAAVLAGRAHQPALWCLAARSGRAACRGDGDDWRRARPPAGCRRAAPAGSIRPPSFAASDAERRPPRQRIGDLRYSRASARPRHRGRIGSTAGLLRDVAATTTSGSLLCRSPRRSARSRSSRLPRREAGASARSPISWSCPDGCSGPGSTCC